MKILFTGGGTMGSVIPLIAVAEEVRKRNPNTDCFWIGTKLGPESKVIKKYNINFRSISSGKLRRYLSWQNFVDFFKVIVGFFQSIFVLSSLRPKVIVSAGGYVAAPVIWAGWLLGIPVVLYQLDARTTLTNRITTPFARVITCCLSVSLKSFPKKKTILVGSAVRKSLQHDNFHRLKERARGSLGFKKDLPILLVTTGGTGSLRVNDFIESVLPELLEFAYVVHITGRNSQKFDREIENKDRYLRYKFIEDNTEMLVVSDAIVARAGMGTLIEMAWLKKPGVIIPMPDSHQEDNAKYFYDKKAICLMEQDNLDRDFFVSEVKKLLNNKKEAKILGEKAHDSVEWGAEKKIADIIIKLIR